MSSWSTPTILGVVPPSFLLCLIRYKKKWMTSSRANVYTDLQRGKCPWKTLFVNEWAENIQCYWEAAAMKSWDLATPQRSHFSRQRLHCLIQVRLKATAVCFDDPLPVWFRIDLLAETVSLFTGMTTQRELLTRSMLLLTWSAKITFSVFIVGVPIVYLQCTYLRKHWVVLGNCMV